MIINKSRSLSRVSHCDKARRAFENKKKNVKKTRVSEGVYHMKPKSVTISVLRAEDSGYFDLHVFMPTGMC